MDNNVEKLKQIILEEVEKYLNSETEVKKIDLTEKILVMVRKLYDIQWDKNEEF